MLQTSRSAVLLTALLSIALLLGACAPKQPLPPQPAPPTIAEPPREPLPDRLGQWKPLVERLLAEGFERERLIALFSRPDLQFDPAPMRTKLAELLRVHFNRERTRAIQESLATLGFDPGPTDGLSGERTRLAIQAFQQVKGLPKDGEPSDALRELLVAEVQRPRELWVRPPADFVPGPDAPVSKAVYDSLLTPKQLAASVSFYRTHLPLLRVMQQRYSVPPELAVAIFTVETRLGEYLGGRKAFAALAGMALSRDFGLIRPYLENPPASPEEEVFLRDKALERGDWAYAELVALLRYAQSKGRDPLDIPGSIYGAIGLGQFMPSNAVTYGVDGDGDGRVDLFTLEDAVMSFGNFMQAMGWEGDMRDEAAQRKVLMRYNRSVRYVNTVLAVEGHIKRNGM